MRCRQPPAGQLDRGDMAVEAAIAAPVFLLLIAMVIFGGRVAMTHQAVDAAAAEAARAASIARSSGQAGTDATTWANASLANHNLDCANLTVQVDTSGFSFPVGTAADATVTLTCQINLSDLALPGVSGSHTISSTVTSPIDTHRARG